MKQTKLLLTMLLGLVIVSTSFSQENFGYYEIDGEIIKVEGKKRSDITDEDVQKAKENPGKVIWIDDAIGQNFRMVDGFYYAYDLENHEGIVFVDDKVIPVKNKVNTIPVGPKAAWFLAFMFISTILVVASHFFEERNHILIISILVFIFSGVFIPKELILQQLVLLIGPLCIVCVAYFREKAAKFNRSKLWIGVSYSSYYVAVSTYLLFIYYSLF